MKRNIIIILIVGILIRLLLAFSTFHSDVQPFYFAGEVISKGNILTFYDYLGNLSKTDPILKIYPTDLFNYPPLVYFTLGPISYFISLPFSRELLHNFIYKLPSLLGNLQLNFLLLTLKIPYLIFDLGVASLFYKLFEKPKNKLLALTLWIFNPINLYATYMMGQFDVVPTFFALLALYFAIKKNKYFLSALFLGLGASFKIFPILFLIPLALMSGKWLERIKIFSIGISTYIATILPFINSHGFRSTALVAGQTTKSLYANIPISSGETILIFPFLIILFYLFFLFSKVKEKDLWSRFFMVILLFFVFTHTHPQWFLWITPFWIIDLVKSQFKHWPLALAMVVVWILQVSFFDPGLSVWLFSPIFPNLYGKVGVWGASIDVNLMRSFLKTVFASTAFYYIYYLWHQ